MGDFFELQEMGILDEMGEYIGDGNEGWHVQSESGARNSQIRNFMQQRGLITPKAQKRALKEYGVEFKTDRPTFHAFNNWKLFKEFINKRVGYNPAKNTK